MRSAALVLIMMLSGITRADRPDCVPSEAKQQSNSATSQITQINNNQIKITIATGGGLFGPTKDTYRVGQRVPVVITMTNTGSQPVYVSESASLYQDRPQLLKDGKPVDYQSFRQTSVDDNGWYEPLQPGKYTLSNRRRLNACDGPLMETNTISFVVVP